MNIEKETKEFQIIISSLPKLIPIISSVLFTNWLGRTTQKA